MKVKENKKKTLFISLPIFIFILIFSSLFYIYKGKENSIELEREPAVGEVSFLDENSSAYIWNKVTIKYIYDGIRWQKISEIHSRPYVESSISQYLDNLKGIGIDIPKYKGYDNEEVSQSFWMYMGEGIKSEIIIKKLEIQRNKSNV
ncbi:hypothetical protein [Clostridium cellulovorans]|uniref:Uncharacterized protein n=1 Tax=Clostridium cellulovorans (strain ATCC 35296 / DSM 3052 / OCM 3 / 743B) TaxID=573061 RepID=D9SSY5_CLOC7|nr:hypothetical protein [Clostridium cellulovorans]ADL52647.1 hypothetical protein Clocel_2955 [Clostridium cellulovorans 743B]